MTLRTVRISGEIRCDDPACRCATFVSGSDEADLKADAERQGWSWQRMLDLITGPTDPVHYCPDHKDEKP